MRALKPAAFGALFASAVIVTTQAKLIIDEVVHQVRSIRLDVPIFSRARDADHARHLYKIGVTDAVPETVEASLQLAETSLVGLGIPMGPVIASIHDVRDEFRHDLQRAAKEAGLPSSYSARAKKRA